MEKCMLYLVCKEVAELDTLDGKVDNGRILLHKEGVLCEPLDVQDDEPNRTGNYQKILVYVA
jgi:hypothetical protein